MKLDCLGSDASATAFQLNDLGQVTQPLCLVNLVFEMRMVLVLPSQVVVRIKWINACETFSLVTQ